MMGTSLQFGKGNGDDRSFNEAKARRNHRNSSTREKTFVFDRSNNLNRFLFSTAPSVPAQNHSKTRMRMLKTCDVENKPYFTLGDLWESFKEWSAYGAGVPLVLNEKDSVIQYYVPYLSGIQLYGDMGWPYEDPRQSGEDSDIDSYRDSSSYGSSDCELESTMKYVRECSWKHLANDSTYGIERSVGADHVMQEDFSSDDSDAGNSQGCLIFQYLESDPPFSREPLADKISVLADQFPGLKSFRSCDLSPASWVSVAWYPIYRIPTGRSLKDLDACFLTFHSLSTPLSGAAATRPEGVDGASKISLPSFGLASYKFKGSLWTPSGGCEKQLASSLLQAADNWLRFLSVDHPDYRFFTSRGTFRI